MKATTAFVLNEFGRAIARKREWREGHRAPSAAFLAEKVGTSKMAEGSPQVCLTMLVVSPCVPLQSEMGMARQMFASLPLKKLFRASRISSRCLLPDHEGFFGYVQAIFARRPWKPNGMRLIIKWTSLLAKRFVASQIVRVSIAGGEMVLDLEVRLVKVLYPWIRFPAYWPTELL